MQVGDATYSQEGETPWVVRTMGKFQVGCSWKGLLGNLRFGTTGKPWGCPPMGLIDSGQRTRRSLSFQVSWQPCSLLPPSESQPRPAREIPSEARAKVLWVCVCVCWWCICMVCCIHVACAWVPYVACVCMLLFTEPEPHRLKPKPLCPRAQPSWRWAGLPRLSALHPPPLSL